MAGNLIDLAEAAKLLNLSPEQVTELSQKGSLRSFRAGSSLKFKQADVENYLAEQAAGGESSLSLSEDADSLLVEDAGKSGAKPGSVIGVGSDDSDIELSTGSIDSDLALDDSSVGQGDSEFGLEDSAIAGDKPKADSDINLGSEMSLVPDSEGTGVNLVAGDSDIDILSGSGIDQGTPSGSGILGADSDFGFDDGESNIPSSDLAIGDGDTGGMELGLADDSNDEGEELTLGGSSLTLDDDDLALDSGIALDSNISGSDIGGSEIDLAADDDDDLVLGGSGIGSDLTLSAADSGINLNPNDSGLSLDEEPLELTGSSVDALELPEDDDIALDDVIGDPDAATQLKQDDEFFLTPVEDDGDDDESGSQVIALEDSMGYADPAAATMLGQPGGDEVGAALDGMGDAAPAMLVAEDPDMFGGPQPAGGGSVTPQMMPQPAQAPAAAPEAPYSVWNVLTLLMVLMLMIFGGMLMMDLVRNMWTFEGGVASTTMMDTIVEALQLSPDTGAPN